MIPAIDFGPRSAGLFPWIPSKGGTLPSKAGIAADGAPSLHLEPVCDPLEALGHRVKRQQVAY
jgi:hypothetical protein